MLLRGAVRLSSTTVYSRAVKPKAPTVPKQIYSSTPHSRKQFCPNLLVVRGYMTNAMRAISDMFATASNAKLYTVKNGKANNPESKYTEYPPMIWRKANILVSPRELAIVLQWNGHVQVPLSFLF